jgi:hypothetical protein
MQQTTRLLGVSQQTVLQRVKRRQIDAVLVSRERAKGLHIKVVNQLPDLFEPVP